jgi:hypothetical protein
MPVRGGDIDHATTYPIPLFRLFDLQSYATAENIRHQATMAWV